MLPHQLYMIIYAHYKCAEITEEQYNEAITRNQLTLLGNPSFKDYQMFVVELNGAIEHAYGSVMAEKAAKAELRAKTLLLLNTSVENKQITNEEYRAIFDVFKEENIKYSQHIDIDLIRLCDVINTAAVRNGKRIFLSHSLDTRTRDSISFTLSIVRRK